MSPVLCNAKVPWSSLSTLLSNLIAFSGCTGDKDRVSEPPLIIQIELSRTEEDHLIFISYCGGGSIDMSLPFIELSYRFQPLPMVVYSNPVAASLPVLLSMAFWTAVRSISYYVC